MGRVLEWIRPCASSRGMTFTDGLARGKRGPPRGRARLLASDQKGELNSSCCGGALSAVSFRDVVWSECSSGRKIRNRALLPRCLLLLVLLLLRSVAVAAGGQCVRCLFFVFSRRCTSINVLVVLVCRSCSLLVINAACI